MRRGSRTARQAAILSLIGGGHVLLYLALPAPLPAARGASAAAALALQFLPPPTPRVPRQLERTGRSRASSGAPAVPPPAPPLPASQEAVARDWVGAAERAARTAVQPDPRRGFGMPQPAPAPSGVRPEFGWSRARTRPIEPLETGGFVYHINDRCMVVVVLVPLPFCRLGTIPARSDLFDHLHDAPLAGDWQEPR